MWNETMINLATILVIGRQTMMTAVMAILAKRRRNSKRVLEGF